jgi:nicotinamidase-related amidase
VEYVMSVLQKEERSVIRSPSEKFAHMVNGGVLHAAAYFHHAKSESTSADAEFTLMSADSTDKGLLTPGNCVVIFIDHQPQMFFGIANIDRQLLLNNLLILAKAAKIFGLPVIITAVESKGFTGNITPELLDLFPDRTPIERSSMNAWDSKDFVESVKASRRKNLLVAALWSEVCLVMPAVQALTDGYSIYAVEDASGGTSAVAHAAAIRRIEQAGAVSVTALQVLLEFQRDWSRKEHFDEVMAVVKEHCGADGQGVEYAATMVHKAPASRKS